MIDIISPNNILEQLHREYHNFLVKKNRHPEILIINPNDNEMFVEVLTKGFGVSLSSYSDVEILPRFQNTKLLRSHDIRRREFKFY